MSNGEPIYARRDSTKGPDEPNLARRLNRRTLPNFPGWMEWAEIDVVIPILITSTETKRLPAQSGCIWVDGVDL